MPWTAPPVHLLLGKDIRHPDILGEPKGLAIEPIPIDEEISSLPECTRRQV